ncbi:MAG: V-type ATP synthase subunit E [Anaerolineales bacterium]|jgi:V/A-type H+-transporting ATPase subunit E
MRSEEENLQALTRTVQEAARNEADRILADAKTQADQIRRRGREEAEAQRKEILDRAARDSEHLRSQAVATARMQARKRELEHRDRLLEGIFAEAERRIPEIAKRPDYELIAMRLAGEAAEHLASDSLRIRADERTRRILTKERLDDLSRKTGVKMQAGPALENGTGVVAETADGHRRYDNTLETRLQRMRNELRAAAYRILTGEES